MALPCQARRTRGAPAPRSAVPWAKHPLLPPIGRTVRTPWPWLQNALTSETSPELGVPAAGYTAGGNALLFGLCGDRPPTTAGRETAGDVPGRWPSDMPAAEEIRRVRHLVSQIKGDIDRMGAGRRAQIDEAVSVVRRHRAAHLGMPSVRVKTAGRQPSPGSGRGSCNGGNATRPATFRDAQLSSAAARPGFGWAGTFHPPARRSARQGHPRTAATRSITRMEKAHSTVAMTLRCLYCAGADGSEAARGSHVEGDSDPQP
jgi:hypothetical protein